MDDTQLMKGILEGCVLGIIAKGETYGYEILSALEKYGLDEVQEGTLYPVLTRLSKKEYIVCRKAKSPLGPIRKYFRITEEGRAYYKGFCESYQKVTQAADAILLADRRKCLRDSGEGEA